MCEASWPKTGKEKAILHHAVNRQLGKDLATFFNLLLVFASRSQHFIRDLIKVIDMENVSLLLKHARDCEAAAVHPMIVVGVLRMKLVEIIGMLLLNTFPLFVVWITRYE